MNTITKIDVDGILFDLGSTLLEYETIPWDELNLLCVEAGYEYLRENGHPVPTLEEFTQAYLDIRSSYRERASASLKEWVVVDLAEELLKSCGINGDGRLAQKYFEAYAEPLARQVTMFADVPTVLQRLKENGKKIGLVSNTIFPGEYHRRELEAYGILQYFDFTVFSSSFGYRKPHPSIYRYAVELMNSRPNRLLFIGDRYPEDYQGPREYGLHAMIKYREGRDYPDPMPDGMIVLRALSELLGYLEGDFDDISQ